MTVYFSSDARLLLFDCHRDSVLCVRLLGLTCISEAPTHLPTSYALLKLYLTHTTIDTAVAYPAPQSIDPKK